VKKRKMFAVNGIYNGKEVRITYKFFDSKKYKVVITFIEELHEEESDLRSFSNQETGLEFWNDAAEDVYQDYIIHKSQNNENR
jgi:hypothetical protein